MTFTIEFFTEPDAFTRLQNEWQALLEGSARNTIFLTPVWQNVWWKIFHPGELVIITARAARNRLVGVAPLYRATNQAQGELYLVGTGFSDYLDWVVADENAEEIFAALFDALFDARMPQWDALVLSDLRANSLWLHADGLANTRGLHLDLAPLISAPALTLPRDWESYLNTLDKKQRHELRRKFRRIEEVETRWYTLDTRAELARGVDDFIALHEASSDNKAEFWDATLREFFRALAYELFDQGWLKLDFLEIQGERAASAFTFDYADQILAYNSGYDQQRFAAYSPGVILFGFSIRDAINAGRAVFDFLRGTEPYKYRFGAKEQQLYKLVVRR